MRDIALGEQWRFLARCLAVEAAGQLVTLTALRSKTGISDRQIRERLDRVKLRSESEVLTLNAALGCSSSLALLSVFLETEVSPARNHNGNPLKRRGPPVGIASASPLPK